MLAPATYIAIYAIVWWICLFIVLPFGARSQHEAGGEIVRGSEPGAPVMPMWGRRMLITTLVSIPVTALVFWGLSTPWLQEYWS